jgi:hypothetical protein
MSRTWTRYIGVSLQAAQPAQKIKRIMQNLDVIPMSMTKCFRPLYHQRPVLLLNEKNSINPKVSFPSSYCLFSLSVANIANIDFVAAAVAAAVTQCQT